MIVSHQARPSNDNGFLLLEALIVLMILAMSASIAAPLLQRSRPGDDVRAKAIEVSGLLKAARSVARKSSRTQLISYSVPARRLTWTQGAKAVVVPATMSLRLVDGSGLPTAKSSNQPGASQSGIRFLRDGSSNSATIQLRSAGRTATLTTDWLTGETRLRVAN